MNNLLQKNCIFLFFIEFSGEKYPFQSYWRMNYTAPWIIEHIGPHFLKPGLDHKPSNCKRSNSSGTRFKCAAVGPLSPKVSGCWTTPKSFLFLF